MFARSLRAPFTCLKFVCFFEMGSGNLVIWGWAFERRGARLPNCMEILLVNILEQSIARMPVVGFQIMYYICVPYRLV